MNKNKNQVRFYKNFRRMKIRTEIMERQIRKNKYSEIQELKKNKGRERKQKG